MHTTLIICAAALGLLVFSLGFNVSLTRARTKDVHSGGSDPAGMMMKAVRAHANASEYIGVIIALFVVTALVYQGRDLGLTVSIFVIGITIARFVHAFGMLTCKTLAEPNPFRFIGAFFTFTFGFLLSGILLAKALF